MPSHLSPIAITAALLVVSNVFMTFAWYGHLKHMNTQPWLIAVFASWGIAFFEYLVQVPANRIGFTVMSLAQLKILPFAVLYMGEPLRLNYLWAGLCLMGAVYFIFAI